MINYKCNPCTYGQGVCPVNCYEANRREGKVQTEDEYEALKKSDDKFKDLNQIWGATLLE